MPVAVRYEEFKTKEEWQRQFEKIIDLYQQKLDFKQGLNTDDLEILDVLNEVQYPQDEEFKIFIELVKMIKLNLAFIHPVDENKSNLKNFITC